MNLMLKPHFAIKLTSWMLWDALKNPPYRHALYRRTIESSLRLPRWYNERVLPTVYFMLAMGLCPCFMVVSAVLARPGWLVIAALLLVVLSGTRYGLIWSLQVGEFIARERERSTFDMLGIAPDGALGASWMICVACMYRDQKFRDLETQHSIFTRVALLALAMLTLLILCNLFNAGDVDYLSIPIAAAALVAIYYFDHIHSVILGGLIGMLIPTYASARNDSRLLTVSSFIVLQATTYVVSWIFAFFVLPGVFDAIGIYGAVASLLQAIMSVGLFYLIRESIITILWLKLTEQLNAPTNSDPYTFGELYRTRSRPIA
jgi:hypothetical protein